MKYNKGTKKIILLLLTMSGFCTTYGQPWADLLNPKINLETPAYRIMMEDVNISWYDVEVAYYKYWADQNKTANEAEGGSEFERYLDFMKLNSDEYGLYQPIERNNNFWNKIQKTRSPDAQKNIVTANWVPIGPDVLDGDGDLNNSRMHSFHQDSNNNDLLWVGAGTAGVWKSINGGSSWTCISNSMEKARNIDAVLPDRTNLNHIIVASRDNGLFRTTNNGVSWTKATGFNKAYKVHQHPITATTWYASANDGFYESINNGVSWTQLFAATKIHDFEMHPTNPLIIYLLEEIDDVNNENQHIYKSIDGGSNFSLLTNGLPADVDGDFSRAEIAVTPAAPDNLYAVYSDATNGGLYGVYVSTNAGANFTFQCCGSSPGGPYSSSNFNILGYGSGTGAGGQLNYQQSLYVSPTNANLIFSGGVFLWYSSDMGVTWTKSNNTYHADNHGVFINNSGNVYTATDGGVHLSTDGGVTFNSLTDGIYGTEFVGDFGFSRKNEAVMIGGTLHNGAIGKYENNYNNWKFYAGGDLREGYVDMAQSIFRVSPNSSNNRIRRSKNGGANFSLLSTASRFIATHPNTPSILYSPDVGLYNLWKSQDDGLTWTKITNFSTSTSVSVCDIEICESSPDNMALNLRNERKIAVSADGGQTWINKTIPIHGSRKVEDLIINHQDPLIMWIVYDKEYVYKTTDGGNSWVNYNTGINTSLNLTSITHHVGSNDAVYLGGENMVYYRDNSMSSWASYSVGLPTSIIIKDIEVIYDNNKIRLSSNRSVWESDLNSAVSPKAAISASTLTINDCENLSIQYYDASFVSTAGTSWNWTFEGGTPATSTLQNPIIAYAVMGTYDVTLQVTNGSSNTKTISDLITVNISPITVFPIMEDIENFTYSGTTGGCSPPVVLGGSLTNLNDFPNDNTDWRVNSGSGINNTTGPLVDYTEGSNTGQYLYLRGSSGCGERTGAFITDCFDFNSMVEPTLTFAYQAIKTNGVAAPELHVDVYSNGVWITDVLEILGEQGARNGNVMDWEVFNLDLTAYANTIVKLRIWGTSSTNGVICDLALDGIQVYDATALPVEWLSFTAHLNERNEGVLNWETATEINTDKFIIQKSRDGHSFENIGEVSAAQQSNIVQHYSFIDEKPYQGVTYYRIQQLDLDNKIDYSIIKSVQVDAALAIRVYPNPISLSQQLYIDSNNDLPLRVELYNALGQEFLFQQVPGNSYLDLSSFTPGVYIYKIENKKAGIIGQLFIFN